MSTNRPRSASADRGAGKTTTVEILEGFRRATAGEISVFGSDPCHAPTSARERIGIVLQEGCRRAGIDGPSVLAFYAGYYRAPRPWTRRLRGSVTLS